MITNKVARREFMQWSAGGAAAAALMPLTACGTRAGGTKPRQLVVGDDVRVAFDRDGRTLRLDPSLSEVALVDEAGQARTLGTFGQRAGEFNNPVAAAFDRQGQMFVLDRGNHRVQVFSKLGEFASEFGREAGLLMPAALAVDARDRVWVADSLNHRLAVFEAGKLVATYGELGSESGQLNNPIGIALQQRTGSDDEIVWVLDSGNHRVARFTTAGRVLRPVEMPQQWMLRSIAISGDQRVFVSDLSTAGVLVFDSDGNKLETRDLRSAAGNPLMVMQLVVDASGDVHAASQEVR